MMKAAMMVVTILGVTGLCACEKAGENMDNAIDDLRGERDLGDGAMEKAGAAIDNTVGTERRNDADSVADAIDGDASTKPNELSSRKDCQAAPVRACPAIRRTGANGEWHVLTCDGRDERS